MKTLFIFGTRPEAIKLAPLIKEFQRHPSYTVSTCTSGQHKEMLDQVLDFFHIEADYRLNLMKPNQTLFDVTVDGLKGLEEVLEKATPDLIFVQGDTTTAFVGALAGYYKKIKVAHVEAGLRSGNKYSPFPEEANRTLIGHLCDFHFVPTPRAQHNLAREGIRAQVWQVGNTVIDALLLGIELVEKMDQEIFLQKFEKVDFSKKVILVTGHRRESFGGPFENICQAIKTVAERFADQVQVVYPVHLNPNVRGVVHTVLQGLPNVHLIEPLDYPHLLWLMNKSYLVLTDSGGIQEEAPALGKPVLVMRDVTERQEGIEAGTAKLVGTDYEVVVASVAELLIDEVAYTKMAQAVNPYGDGTTSRQIRETMDSFIR